VAEERTFPAGSASAASGRFSQAVLAGEWLLFMAISPAGVVGLAQLMPGTASDLGVRNRYDPDANINGGARYLRQMLGQFGGVHLALAAYNAGPNAVKRAKGIPKNRETPDYVRSVIARWTETRS